MAIFGVDTNNDGVDFGASGLDTFSDTASWSLAFKMRHKDGTRAAGAEHVFLIEQNASNRIRVRIESNEQLTFQFEIGGTNVEAFCTATHITDTNWHSWVCVYESGTKDITVYVDGVEDATDTGTPGSGTITPVFYNALFDEGGSNSTGNIEMHDLAIWHRELTLGECEALHAGATPTMLPAHNRYIYCPFLDNLNDEWGSLAGGNIAWSTTPGANWGFTDTSAAVQWRNPDSAISGDMVGVAAQNITAVLLTATGLFAPTSIDQNLDVTAPLISATGLFAAASINQLGVISAPLLGATMLAASIQYDQSVTAPVVNATGPFASSSITQNLDVTAPLLSATGQLVGSLAFNQVITASLLSATGLVTAGSITLLWTLVSPNTDTDFVVVSPNTDTDFTEVN